MTSMNVITISTPLLRQDAHCLIDRLVVQELHRIDTLCTKCRLTVSLVEERDRSSVGLVGCHIQKKL